MHLLFASRKGNKKSSAKFFVDQNCFPQTVDVLKTRSAPLGIELVVGDLSKLDLTDSGLFAIYIQNPDSNGAVKDYTDLVTTAHEREVHVAMRTDLMSLVLMKSPGEMGADVVVGS